METWFKFLLKQVVHFNPADLDKEQVRNEIQSDKYHIYMICKQKKLFFDSSWTDDEGFTRIKLYWLNETHDKVFVGCRSSGDLTIHSVKDGYYNIEFKEHKNIFCQGLLDDK